MIIRFCRKPLSGVVMRVGWLLVRLTIVRCRNSRSDRIKVWPSWKNCLFEPPGVAHSHFSMIVLFVWVQVSWIDKHLHNAGLTLSGEERARIGVQAVVLLSVRKVSTGEKRVITLEAKHPLITRIGADNTEELIHYLLFELEDNNWSCDCNRCQFFGDADAEGCQASEYAVDWFSVDGRRFAATDEYGHEFCEQNAVNHQQEEVSRE